ncbi:sterol desaturase/sphingolipid hydroxylase (fatty acid hydroxylase superfamily) [Kitasatospora sp. MAA19]|uniref:hypothetical protein n=1 Tax=Kitasatospora sp. MAA19 TaxID=3035090 RepID=UPI002476478F|nr:hypothetical protein [Kitasatospora sp. MAA19]MDH6707569.1 sterol desaturase/sphingolipid hydroxylase (fatty acid hydroxylase superfamily) [Kitasatospora sp. MAA19]
MTTDVLTERAAAAPAAPAAPEPPTRRRRGRLLWLTWRQSRITLWAIAGLLVLASATLLWLHFSLQQMVDDLDRAGCHDSDSWSTINCWSLIDPIDRRSVVYTQWLQPAAAAVPLLLGMFVGAPLLAQEYERGTVRLAWTQSVSPLRWLGARIALPGLVALAAAGVLAVLMTWVWWVDIAHGPVAFDPPFQSFTYPVLGVVPVAWSLFALALGLLVGQLLRRTVAAILVTGVLVAAAHGLVRWTRPFFYPTVKEVVPLNGWQPHNAWLVDRGPVLADGRWVSTDSCRGHWERCASTTHSWIEYHPADHFVPIQLVETGLLVALTAAALALVFHRARRDGHALRATRRA